MFHAAPGSRSTPLVTAAAEHPAANLTMHVDERGTAFRTLGFGRATGRPAVWITTSGTALANGYPAIVEASMERVPMLLLTADRPPELRDTDANQTIRQDHMFGRYVTWFTELAPPSSDLPAEVALTTIDQAIARSVDGPVHVNCLFREPLAPTVEPFDSTMSERLSTWMNGHHPFTDYRKASSVNREDVDPLLERLRSSRRPLFILGRLRSDGERLEKAVHELCKATGGWFVADIGSQVRLGSQSDRHLVHFDALLSSEAPHAPEPDLVILFGASPVGKRLNAYIASKRLCVVDDRLRRIDPHHSAELRLEASPLEVLEELTGEIIQSIASGGDESWMEAMRGVREATLAWSETEFGTQPAEKLTEQRTARILSERLQSSMALTVASSNSIRHMDFCASANGARVALSCNRGASGIDGTIATAIGFAEAREERPVILIGDLALLHDLNSLMLCRQAGAIIVVVNNDGGGIFSYLPVREFTDVFEPYFGTPHGMSFEHVARQFGLEYEAPDSPGTFRIALDAAIESSGASLIEVVTDRTENLEEQRRLLRTLRERVGSGGSE